MRLGYESQRESARNRIRTRARRLRYRLDGSGGAVDYGLGDEDLDSDFDEDFADDDLDEEVGEGGFGSSAKISGIELTSAVRPAPV
jgi:hypothetical protein